jgi:hypothetical protein
VDRGTYQQYNVKNVLAGDTGCDGCGFCSAEIFCDTLRSGKKIVLQVRPPAADPDSTG